MDVRFAGDNKYVAREGAVEIHCHVENNKGLRTLWIDKIEIHGTVESSVLIIRLRKLRKYFQKMWKVI